MRFKATFLAFAALPVSLFGDDRTLHFVHTETAQQAQEIGTVIRSIGEIRQLSVDSEQRLLTVNGTPAQIALAAWLFTELDQTANRQPVSPEYKLTDSPSDVVRVIYLAPTHTITQFQEVVTAVRSITEIRRVFTYSTPRAVIMRGTESQIALAEWLFRELEKPDSQNATATEYPLSGAAGEAVGVFYVPHTPTQQDFQEVATVVRSIGDIRRLFTYFGRRAVLARGTSDELAFARWLIGELDQPAQNPTTPEYRLSGGGDNMVRVFYLSHAGSVQRLQEIAVQVRTITAVRRLFTYARPKAITVRGTADQIAMAERLIEERDR